MYNKKEVEAIVARIIHQDSFGDVHWEANKVASELGMDFSKKEIPEEDEDE